MKVDGKRMRPIWFDEKTRQVQVIDQRRLPHEWVVMDLTSVDHVILAIEELVVRGAPLIGATGAYGVYVAAVQALRDGRDEVSFLSACERIKAARPTAVNLSWGVDRVLAEIAAVSGLSAS